MVFYGVHRQAVDLYVTFGIEERISIINIIILCAKRWHTPSSGRQRYYRLLLTTDVSVKYLGRVLYNVLSCNNSWVYVLKGCTIQVICVALGVWTPPPRCVNVIKEHYWECSVLQSFHHLTNSFKIQQAKFQIILKCSLAVKLGVMFFCFCINSVWCICYVCLGKLYAPGKGIIVYKLGKGLSIAI